MHPSALRATSLSSPLTPTVHVSVNAGVKSPRSSGADGGRPATLSFIKRVPLSRRSSCWVAAVDRDKSDAARQRRRRTKRRCAGLRVRLSR